MRTIILSVIFCAVGLVSPAQAVDVKRTVDVNASAEEVWQAIGSFCAIADWYPGIDTCTEETVDGVVHRRLVTADGAEFFEKRLANDPSSFSYSYAILEGPLPVKDYAATFSVNRNGETSTVVWESAFEADGVSDEEGAEILSGVYDTGLEAISAMFAE